MILSLSGLIGWWLLASVLRGVDLTMAYPSLIAAVSHALQPNWRARSLSVYRLWPVLAMHR